MQVTGEGSVDSKRESAHGGDKIILVGDGGGGSWLLCTLCCVSRVSVLCCVLCCTVLRELGLCVVLRELWFCCCGCLFFVVPCRSFP